MGDSDAFPVNCQPSGLNYHRVYREEKALLILGIREEGVLLAWGGEGYVFVRRPSAARPTDVRRPPAGRRAPDAVAPAPSPPRRTPSPVGYAIGDIALNM